MKPSVKCAAGILGFALATSAFAQDNKLRLITWADYVPADVVAQFKKETGIDVEITLSNNEEMISKLRATGGAGFDLAQPSQDRIVGPQQEFGIYKPMDMTKIKTELFIPSMLDATKKNTTLKGKVYGLPHIWGTDGLVVNTKLAQMADYPDLCKAEVQGQDQHAPEAADAARLRVRERQGPVRAVQRSQGLRGADGRRRQEARRVQGRTSSSSGTTRTSC